MNRKEIKEQELQFLAESRRKNPKLFVRQTNIDDASFLEGIGIVLPQQIKSNVFLGYLKLWPQDFIVEEILQDGTVQTVWAGNTLKEFTEEGKKTAAYATLVKCGISTVEAVEDIASLGSLDKKQIEFAGIKDKDAITAQLISIKGADLAVLQGITSPFFFFKDMHQSKGVMTIGGLKGNQFTIFVRTDHHFKKEPFLENVELVKKEGFYNFFYSQRFSSPRYVNWSWGLSIMKGEYEQAVKSVLYGTGEREYLYMKALRAKALEQKDDWGAVEEIFKPLSLTFPTELKMLSHLKKSPKDFLGALQMVPEQVQLWVYAYASLLFNKKISQFIKEEKELPKAFPLVVSRNKAVWAFYEDLLKADGIVTMPVRQLAPFPNIQWQGKEIHTKERVQIHQIEIVKEGVALNFNLPKGCYATTFLSHLFQLVSDVPPEHIVREKVDVKEILGKQSLRDTLEKFAEVIQSKAEDALEAE